MSLGPLRAANFDDASLFETEVPGADLRYAVLRNVLFEAVHARNAKLSKADLEEADLFFTLMNGANLNGANLGHASMGLTELRGADLRNANLLGAFLNGAHLSDVIGGNTICPDGTNSDLDDGDDFSREGNLSPFG